MQSHDAAHGPEARNGSTLRTIAVWGSLWLLPLILPKRDGQALKVIAQRFKRKANTVAQAICRIRSGLRSCIDARREA